MQPRLQTTGTQRNSFFWLKLLFLYFYDIFQKYSFINSIVNIYIFIFCIFSRVFGFVARKPTSQTDNQCHLFAELEPEQPASAIVNFVTKVMMTGTQQNSQMV